MRRRVSTGLSTLSMKRASSNLSAMAKLKRKSTAPRSSEGGGGFGTMVKRFLGFGSRDDPDVRSQKGLDETQGASNVEERSVEGSLRDEAREAYTAEDESTGGSARESFESSVSIIEDNTDPKALGTETQTCNPSTTPFKHHKPKVDLTRGMLGSFDEYDDSSAPSSCSSVASLLFSPDEGNLGETPDTTFSGDFEFDTPGKDVSTREDGTSNADETVDAATPSPRYDEEDSITFNSTNSRAPNTGKSFIKSNLTADFKPRTRYRKRLPRAASHQLETPTKARVAPHDIAPTSKEDDDGDADEDEEDEDEQLWELYTHSYSKAENVDRSEEHPHFEPKPKDQYKALEKTLGRLGTGVKPLDLAKGYIYIYKRDTALGFLKIGRSMYPDGTRMKQITEKCGHDLKGANLVHEQEMKVAHKAVEKCVHDHLHACHYWDLRCVMTYEERKRTEQEQGRKTCRRDHIEWFKTSEERAKEVVSFWNSFIATQPYDPKGRLKPFWMDVLVRVWDAIPRMKQEGIPAFSRLEDEIGDALKGEGWKEKSIPVVELAPNRVPSLEGEGSVQDGDDKTGDELPVALPVRTRRTRRTPRVGRGV